MSRLLKNLVRKSTFVTNVVAFLYNMLFSNCRLQIILGNISAKGVFLKGTRFVIRGNHNRISLGKGSSLNCCTIFVQGNGCNFVLGGVKYLTLSYI